MLSFADASINAQSYFVARSIPFSNETTREEERSSLLPHINIGVPGEVNCLAFWMKPSTSSNDSWSVIS